MPRKTPCRNCHVSTSKSLVPRYASIVGTIDDHYRKKIESTRDEYTRDLAWLRTEFERALAKAKTLGENEVIFQIHRSDNGPNAWSVRDFLADYKDEYVFDVTHTRETDEDRYLCAEFYEFVATRKL